MSDRNDRRDQGGRGRGGQRQGGQGQGGQRQGGQGQGGQRQGGQPPRGGQPRQPQGNETPSAIVFVAVGCGVMGLMSLLYGLSVTLLGGILGGLGSAMGDMATTAEGAEAAREASTAAGLLTILGFVQIVTAMIKFVGIYGVMKARSWAFYMLGGTFGFEVLLNVLGFVGIVVPGSGFGVLSIVIFAMNAGILALLFVNQDYFGVSLGGGGGDARARV